MKKTLLRTFEQGEVKLTIHDLDGHGFRVTVKKHGEEDQVEEFETFGGASDYAFGFLKNLLSQKYRFGVSWIALNDDAGSADALDAENVSGYVSTLLLADVFGLDSKKVAKDIVAYRRLRAWKPTPVQQARLSQGIHELAREVAEKLSLSDKERKVVRCIEALEKSLGHGAKSAYLAMETGITKSELNRTLNSLIDKGIISRTGRHIHTRYELKKEA